MRTLGSIVLVLAAAMMCQADSLPTFHGTFPNGKFEVRRADGGLGCVGAFVDGKLDGTTVSFASTGDTLSKIGYSRGVLHGDIRLWYLPESLADHDVPDQASGGGRKVHATYRNGLLEGAKNHWYPSGADRCHYICKGGQIQHAQGLDKNRKFVLGHRAFMQADYDLVADLAYYKRLEQIAYSYLPDTVRYYTADAGSTLVRGVGSQHLSLGKPAGHLERALGKGVDAQSVDTGCYYVEYEDPRVRVYYSREGEKALEMLFANKGGCKPIEAKTAEGIGWSSTEEEILAAYGKPRKRRSQRMLAGNALLWYKGISFRFENNRLTVISIY